MREKKYHESDLFQIQIMNLINFGGLIVAINSKSTHQGFSESVKILGAEEKKKKKKYHWNSVKRNVSEGEN